MCVGFALVAPVAVTLLYGHRYTQSALLVALIGILQASRFLTNWPTTVNLSLGRSRAVLAGNLARFLAYPGAFAGVALIGGLDGLVAGFAAGEMVSIVVSVVLMNRAAGRSWHSGFDRLTAFVLTCAAIVGWNMALPRGAALSEIGLALASAGLALWIARRENVAIHQTVAVIRGAMATVFARAGAPG
jgi:O-antigen/teichoic acid export membrane protein